RRISWGRRPCLPGWRARRPAPPPINKMLTLKEKITKAEFKRRADEIIGQLFLEVNAFADVSESAKKARRARTLADPFAFFTTYLPHYFSQEFAPFHHELVALLEKRPEMAGCAPLSRPTYKKPKA